MYKLLEEYYEANFDMFVKMMTKRCGGVMNAEDVVQEAFLHAMRNWHTYDENIAKVSTWFNRILFQTFSKMRNKEWDSVEIEEHHLVSLDIDEEHGYERKLEEVKQLIYDVKNRNHKDILFLSLIAGLEDKQVARQLDESIYNVRQVLKRFRKKLRAKYGD